MSLTYVPIDEDQNLLTQRDNLYQGNSFKAKPRPKGFHCRTIQDACSEVRYSSFEIE